MPAQRWSAVAVTVIAGTCMALAGCGSSSSSAANSAAGGPNKPPASNSPASAGGTSGGSAKLTGNFCTDFKNIGTHIQVPADAEGSLTALQQHGVQYLNEVAAYFNGLAAEAPPQAGTELRTLASDYQAIAGSISSGNVGSLSKIEQQMVSLTTKGSGGAAFRQLISYMVTKCASA